MKGQYMKKVILVFAIIMFPLRVFGQGFYGDVDKFQAYNPDVNKYQFVRSYLNALTYLKFNEDRADFATIGLGLSDKYEQTLKVIERDITNLRIAKNLLDDYMSSSNKMIVKTVDIFTLFCNEQIESDGEEAALINQLFRAQKSGEMAGFDKDTFQQKRTLLSQRRRKSKESLLEASGFVTKILISGEVDRFGQFVSLGVTEKERKKLLKKISVFEEEEYVGEIKTGQSFLQVSVKMIRDMLEDSSWGTLN